MAIMRRITEINGEIIVVETMIIVGEIVLITVQINGELVRYEILSVRQLWEVVRAFSSWSEANKFRITRNRPDWRIV